ncbi:MAG: FeoB-associated Cys-rich membrane protein [Christensenellales bacterium]|jgi:hypothetical protein
MLQFFSENLANILIVAGLATIVSLIVANMIKKKKSGKSIACSSCHGCPSASFCHKQQ